MKEWPILFSGPMALANIEGRKTVTRRMSKRWLKVKAGDLLWQRETWAPFEYCYEDMKPSEIPHCAKIVYLADERGKLSDDKYRPSIHMPRWACRLTMRATEDAREERLHDLTEEDALREGVEERNFFYKCYLKCSGLAPDEDWHDCALDSFESLWRSLHTKPGERWEDNPAVVRIAYELVDK